jgi:alpha-1,2-mannosyltransferase
VIRRGRGSRFGWQLGAVAVAAAVLRLALLWHSGGWHSAIEYDDGVHYESSALLLHGVLPYRDYTFLQPPGITWLLLPSAAVGRFLGDASGLVLARIVTVGAASAATVLLGRLVARHTSPHRGLLAAAVYAVAAPALIAGRTAMLEPWLDVALLVAYDRLGRRALTRRDCVIGGLAMGAAVTVKAWGLLAAIVLLGWLLLRRPRIDARAFGRIVVSACGAVAAVCLPFFVFAPGHMIRDVISAQLGRPVDGTASTFARWAQFLAVKPVFADPRVPVAIATLVVAACAVGALRRGAVAWLMLGEFGTGIVMFALSPPYFFHYGDYLIVPLAALVAFAFPALHPTPGSKRRLRTGAAWSAVWVLAVGGVVQLAAAWQQGTAASVNVDQLNDLVGATRCVTADQPVLLELANATNRDCRPWPDPHGTALLDLPAHVGNRFYPLGFRQVPLFQEDWRAELAASTMVILTGPPCGRMTAWTPALCRTFRQDFRYAGTAGRATPALLPVEVWRRVYPVRTLCHMPSLHPACRQQECRPSLRTSTPRSPLSVLPVRRRLPSTGPTPASTRSASSRSASASWC